MTRYVLQTEAKRMGTHFSFEVSDSREALARAERVLDEADALVRNIESELSEFKPESAVSCFNRSDAGTVHSLSPLFFAIMKASWRLAEQTGFAFDPSFRSGSGTHLFDRIEFDAKARTVKKLHQDVHLAFGAIGKGFALDEVRRLLEAEGFSHFRLNAGGSSIILKGSLDVDAPWPISWAWRKDSDGALLGRSLEFRSDDVLCIGVSGDLEKGAHIARRGPSDEQELRSTWIACDSAADADALSTALYALGWEEGFPLVMDPLKRTAVAAMTNEDIPHWNGFFQKFFGPLEISSTVHHGADAYERKMPL